MTELNEQIPILGQPDKTEDPKIAADLTAIAAWANGGVDQSNFTSAFNAFLSALVPTGVVLPFAGANAPSGWLLCDGSEQSRSTYSHLYEVIGTTFGEGNKSTTFNLPDLRGRAPIGAGTGTGLTTRNRGDKIGEETHILVTAEMPAHSHTRGGGDTGFFGPTGYPRGFNAPGFTSYTGGPAWDVSLIDAVGGSSAHNNVQPVQVVNFMIRT